MNTDYQVAVTSMKDLVELGELQSSMSMRALGNPALLWKRHVGCHIIGGVFICVEIDVVERVPVLD